jgi:hypothetical protein
VAAVRPGPRLTVLAALSFGTGACRPSASAAATATPEAAAACPVDIPAPRGGPRLAPAEQALRARGLAALDAGAWHHARRAFAAILAVAPDDLASLALHDAATRALLADQQRAALAFAAARPLVVPPPPPATAILKKATVATRARAPRPVLLRTTREQSSDDEWQRARCIALPEHQVPNPMRGDPGDVPPGTSPLYGEHVLAVAIADAERTLLLYGPDYRGGRFVAVRAADGERLAFLDLAPWLGGGELAVTWAALADGALYLAFTARDPAAGFLAALDLRTGEPLWRSAPGLAGAADFVVDGAHLLSARAGRLLVVERSTGAVASEHAIDGQPLYLLVRGRRLSVRTDAADHEFELR